MFLYKPQQGSWWHKLLYKLVSPQAFACTPAGKFGRPLVYYYDLPYTQGPVFLPDVSPLQFTITCCSPHCALSKFNRYPHHDKFVMLSIVHVIREAGQNRTTRSLVSTSVSIMIPWPFCIRVFKSSEPRFFEVRLYLLEKLGRGRKEIKTLRAASDAFEHSAFWVGMNRHELKYRAR